MAHKTKATMPGRQWDHSKQNQLTRVNAGGQKGSIAVCGYTPSGRYDNGVLLNRCKIAPVDLPQLSGTDMSRFARIVSQLSGFELASLCFIHVGANLFYFFQELGDSFPSKSVKLLVRKAVPNHPSYFPNSLYNKKTCRIAVRRDLHIYEVQSELLNHKLRICNKSVLYCLYACFFSLNQDFGAFPRCCNSLRIMRFIQADSESSPSSSWAFSIFSRNSGSSLNWNGGLPLLSFLCVDTSITPDVMCLCVMTHYIQGKQIATPRSAGTLPRRLTTNVNSGNEAAMEDHITHPQGRNNYTWRFISMTAGCQSQRYIIVYTNAASEEEARANCPGIHLVFAARLPFQEVQL